MKRCIWIVVIAAALMTACGQAEITSAQNGSLPTAANTTEAASAGTVVQYDGSRITAIYAEDGYYDAASYLATRYSYHLPQIEDDTETAQALNANIQNRFGALITANQLLRVKKESLINDMVYWESSWNGSLLSLYVAATDMAGGREVSVYHYDFADGTTLTNAELLENLGYFEKDTKIALQRAVAQHFDRRFVDALIMPELAALRVRTISDSNCDPMAVELFPTEEGLRAAVPIYNGGRAEFFVTDISFDPDAGFGTGQELQAQDEWFHAAVWKDGSVEVWADTSYTANGLTYDAMSSFYGLADTTDWIVDGCFHNYTDLCMASIGQEYHPYIFLLTEGGTVEYIDVLGNAGHGTMYNGGLLYQVKDIVRFEEGEAHLDSMDYHTVYGVDAYGNRLNLYETISQMNARPKSLVGSWGVNWGTKFLWMDISRDDPYLTYGSNSQDGIEASVPCDAWLAYLGQNANGLIYALHTDRKYEVAAFGPDTEAVYVRHISGEQLLRVPENEYVCFERTYG